MHACFERRPGKLLVLVLLGMALALSGCSQPAPEIAQPGAEQPGQAATGGAAASKQPSVPYDPWLHQPFTKATLAEPPKSQFRPPDQTVTGKSVGKLYERIVGVAGGGGVWDEIKFTTPEGKRLTYHATLKTDLGDVTVELRPDIAPNHVRNFLALARVGYYDGLPFHRTVRQDVTGEKPARLELLEAGCPLGTGEAGYGSIGYWLRPEISDKVIHEEGTLGAWHAEEPESAACRFYITLKRAPWMDGYWTIFGKVTAGLDVLRTINSRPVRADDEFRERPRDPVLIRQVIVQYRETEGKSN